MNMSEMIVAIHQPNFFPWLGFFDKLFRSDVFILMDHVQYPKTGAGTWINRVRILVNGQPIWITVPVVRAYHGHRRISEVEINDSLPWREKMLKTLQMNYSRAPYFGVVFPLIEELVNHSTHFLFFYNLNAILKIVQLLDMKPEKIILSSELSVEKQYATDLLVALTQAVGGTGYLSGDGAGGYQEEGKFAQAGLGLSYQNFHHPIYHQTNVPEFVPGLSILDALMNCGPEGTRQLIAANSSNEVGEV